MIRNERADVTEIRVPYRDTDMHGYLHSAAYLIHTETALAHFWRFRPQIDDEPLYLVRKTECVYHRGLRYDEVALFTVSVAKIGGKSLGFSVAVEVEGTLAAEIDITWIATDSATREPVALPEITRDWLYQFLG